MTGRQRGVDARRRQADDWTERNRYLTALWSDIAQAAHRLGSADRRHIDARAGWTEVEEAAALLAFARAIAEALNWTRSPQAVALALAILRGVEKSRERMDSDGSGPKDSNKLERGHLEELVKACQAKL